MKPVLTIICLLFLCGISFSAESQNSPSAFNRKAYYSAMESNKIDLVNGQLQTLQSISVPGKEAFEGALIMKKAGLAYDPAKKLSLFKTGHRKLETVLQHDSSNAEFRFLRLMIQENAPGILGYKNELKRDSEYIRKFYKNLSDDVRQAILDYSKKSKVLKLEDS